MSLSVLDCKDKSVESWYLSPDVHRDPDRGFHSRVFSVLMDVMRGNLLARKCIVHSWLRWCWTSNWCDSCITLPRHLASLRWHYPANGPDASSLPCLLRRWWWLQLGAFGYIRVRRHESCLLGVIERRSCVWALDGVYWQNAIMYFGVLRIAQVHVHM